MVIEVINRELDEMPPTNERDITGWMTMTRSLQ